MVAVDTATRQVYGARMVDKTTAAIIAAFQGLTMPNARMNVALTSSPQIPQVIDTDQEAGWTRAVEWRTFLQMYGINQRFKADEFSVNNLSMVDNRIRFIKDFIRKRMTAEWGMRAA